ncbi:MAG TPA: hypothetical protein VJG32_04585 [Anaerolineae bacterium]|nr:hypothetical protein [Anaerolineae bacterium]
MKRGKQHRLLIYQRVHRQRRFLFLLAAIVLLIVYLAIAWPLLPQDILDNLPWPPAYDIFLLVASGLFFLVFLYKLVAPRLAYVRCTERNIRIQTPLYPLVISYQRIVATRPNQWGRIFPPEKIKRSQRRLLDGILGEGVLVFDLKSWPVSPRFLKLWMPDVMFLPGNQGLVLWVEDWMTLNREIVDSKDRRRDAQIEAKRETSSYNRMKR